jgi:hypothetical protein
MVRLCGVSDHAWDVKHAYLQEAAFFDALAVLGVLDLVQPCERVITHV